MSAEQSAEQALLLSNVCWHTMSAAAQHLPGMIFDGAQVADCMPCHASGATLRAGADSPPLPHQPQMVRRPSYPGLRRLCGSLCTLSRQLCSPLMPRCHAT